MTIRIAINGYGRIGRNILRALYEGELHSHLEIVAINDIGDVNVNAHLTRYDSVHGKFNADVSVKSDHLVINGDDIKVYSERDPRNLPWRQLKVDVVYECTGLFTDKRAASAHISAGAKKVIISAPGKDVDATVVFGVNENVLKPSHQVISNASCTTNCLAPLAKILHDEIGIESGLMNTIHAVTNDQAVTDVYHPDLRRARAAGESMIPASTGAAAAIGLVIPELNGRLDGLAIRVPTVNVSLVDFSFISSRPTTVEEINSLVQLSAEKAGNGVLTYNADPLVSIDFRHNPASCIFDSTQTRVCGRQVKVLAWYDNEWGFSNRMLDTTMAWMQAGTMPKSNGAQLAG